MAARHAGCLSNVPADMRLGEAIPAAGRSSAFFPGPPSAVGRFGTIVICERLTFGEAGVGHLRWVDEFAINSRIPLATWSLRRRLAVSGTAIFWRSGRLVSRNLARGCRGCIKRSGQLNLRPKQFFCSPRDLCDTPRLQWIVRFFTIFTSLRTYITKVSSRG